MTLKANFKIESRKLKENSTAIDATGVMTQGVRYDTILITEGLGNTGTGYYYTKDALKYAEANRVFEGKKMYSNHPDALQEEIQPERSVKDIIGHFENVKYQEAEDGTGQLMGQLVLPQGDAFDLPRALLNHAIEYSKKYSDQDFVGLSINASGDSQAIEIGEFLEKFNILPAARAKVVQAQTEGLTEVKVVSIIDSAISCDLVTEAGARGKVLKLLEAAKMGKKNEKVKENESKEKAKKHESEENKEGADPNKGSKDQDPAKKKDAAASGDDAQDDQGDQGQTESDEDIGSDDHDDASQDQDLIIQMLKKFGLIPGGDNGGDDGSGGGSDNADKNVDSAMTNDQKQSDNVEAGQDGGDHADIMKAAQHYMQAYKKQGYDSKEAAHRACEAMKMTQDAEAAFNSKKEGDGMDKEDMEVKKESAKGAKPDLAKENTRLLGENARLKEKIDAIEMAEHLDKVLKESKMPMSVTKKFKESAKAYKSKKEVDEKFAIFNEGYKSIAVGEDDVDLDGFVITSEKAPIKESEKSNSKDIDLSDCTE